MAAFGEPTLLPMDWQTILSHAIAIDKGGHKWLALLRGQRVRWQHLENLHYFPWTASNFVYAIAIDKGGTSGLAPMEMG